MGFIVCAAYCCNTANNYSPVQHCHAQLGRQTQHIKTGTAGVYADAVRRSVLQNERERSHNKRSVQILYGGSKETRFWRRLQSGQ